MKESGRACDKAVVPHATADLADPRCVFRRSARARRPSLRIDASAGVVVVTLPTRASRAAGLRLLDEHRRWVTARLDALPPKTLFIDGAVVPIDGEPHVIRSVPAARRGVWREAGVLAVSGDGAFLARRVRDHLRAEARRRLGAIAAEKAAVEGIAISRVAIRDTRTRWGSCSSRRVLMFSWRLVMAPPEVQDYVVAHEVAHLRHMNHGAAFWALCERLSAHRARADAWLAREGARLFRVG